MRSEVSAENVAPARRSSVALRVAFWSLLLMLVPDLAWAQASPFMTGADSLVTNLQAWLTPIAVLLLIVLAFFAMANQISWGWPLSVMLGIVVGFGAPQIVAWVRAMFAV